MDNTAFPHFAFSPSQKGLINSVHTEVGQPCADDLYFKGGKLLKREIFAVVDCQSRNRGCEAVGGCGGEVLRTWEAALRFEPALRALCSWLSPSSGSPPSLCPFLSGSFAFLLSFQDSELLRQLQTGAEVLTVVSTFQARTGSLMELRITGVCAERKTTPATSPSSHSCLPGTEKVRSMDEGTKLCLGYLPSHLPILLLPSAISKTSFPVGSRMLLVLLASYCLTQTLSDLGHPDLLQLPCCCPWLFPHQGHHTYVDSLFFFIEWRCS